MCPNRDRRLDWTMLERWGHALAGTKFYCFNTGIIAHEREQLAQSLPDSGLAGSQTCDLAIENPNQFATKSHDLPGYWNYVSVSRLESIHVRPLFI